MQEDAELAAAEAAAGETTELLDEGEDNEADIDAASMSAHRRRQKQLEAQIAALEQKATSKKDWQMTGEVS